MALIDTLSALEAIASQVRRSTVHVRGRGPGAGSGVIWEAEGVVVTNAHVVRGPEAQIELWDGQTYPVEVLAVDRQRDLASLRVRATDLPAATIGDSDNLRVGQLVMAVGNPLGLSGAVAGGIIHAIDRRPSGSWVHADIRLAPGNSGGPLVDATGRVIGINAMVAGGLGLAVPSNEVRRFLDRQPASRPRLGITLRPVKVPIREEQALGLLVLEVTAASPAERAGLALGDILLAVNGRTLTHVRDLGAALEAGPRSATELDILRGGIPLRLQIASRDVVPASEAA